MKMMLNGILLSAGIPNLTSCVKCKSYHWVIISSLLNWEYRNKAMFQFVSIKTRQHSQGPRSFCLWNLSPSHYLAVFFKGVFYGIFHVFCPGWTKLYYSRYYSLQHHRAPSGKQGMLLLLYGLLYQWGNYFQKSPDLRQTFLNFYWLKCCLFSSFRLTIGNENRLDQTNKQISISLSRTEKGLL